jgi:TonB family protein
VALVLALGTCPAGAAPPGPKLSPPELVSDPGVRYPPTALRERFYEHVEVTLILEVDGAGSVVSASVERPGWPEFDAAALEAARQLRFEPALRDSAPVAAKIKFRYVFDPPAPTLVGRVLDARSGEPIAGARIAVRTSGGSEQALETNGDGAFSALDLPRGKARILVRVDGYETQDSELTLTPGDETRVVFRLERPQVTESSPRAGAVEVTVRGERAAPSVTTYSRAEVRQIPGAFGDPFRAIETLPGVTPVASGLPFFYVRGAPPGNVGYFLDGVRVPYLFHVGFGPSVVQPALVERVDLYPGGYPARLGHFAGGVVSAEATEPRADFHGEGNLRIFDVGAMVEGGFADGRGTALLGGRYSYTAAILSLVAPEITLDYRDYQARFSYNLTPDDRVSVFGFGSYDLAAEDNDLGRTLLFGTEFYRVDTRYDRRWDTGGLGLAVTLGYDHTHVGFLANEPRFVEDRSLAVRAEVREELVPTVLFRGGADVTFDAYALDPSKYADPDDPETQTFNRTFGTRDDIVTGVWVDFVLQVAPRIEVIPGLRVDLYRSGSASDIGIDPRLAARFGVTDAFRIVHAYGLVHQLPSFTLPLAGLAPNLSDAGLQTAAQTSAGVEVDLDDATLATATLFYNAFFNMTDTLGTTTGEDPPDFEARSQGSAVGAEFYLRRRLTKRIGGFISYTLSRSERSAGRERFLSAFDRSHVASAAAGYDLGRGWRPGARFVYYSGTPTPERTGGTIGPPRTTVSERDPSFFRLDVRLEKRWKLRQNAWISFVVEVMNTTLQKETFVGDEIGPLVIPSIGVEAGF